jgi:hypothetical protein
VGNGSRCAHDPCLGVRSTLQRIIVTFIRAMNFLAVEPLVSSLEPRSSTMRELRGSSQIGTEWLSKPAAEGVTGFRFLHQCSGRVIRSSVDFFRNPTPGTSNDELRRGGRQMINNVGRPPSIDALRKISFALERLQGRDAAAFIRLKLTFGSAPDLSWRESTLRSEAPSIKKSTIW